MAREDEVIDGVTGRPVDRHLEGHVHGPADDGTDGRERRLLLVLVLNIAVVVFQVVAGIVAHSLGLLADAGHNLTDVAAIVVSLVAVRLARRPPTLHRPFGLLRATILAALLNSSMILLLTVFLLFEGVQRLLDPEPVEGGIVLVVAVIATVANGLSAWVLMRSGPGGHGHGHDLNMRSALLHMVGDAAASAGVAMAGLVMLLTDGWYWLDPLVSMAIGVLIAWEAWKLLRSATDVLLESVPDGLDPHELAAAIEGVPGVEEVHDLHVWTVSSDMRALSAHLVVEGHPSLEQAQAVADEVRIRIGEPFAIEHATFELECETCVTAPEVVS